MQVMTQETATTKTFGYTENLRPFDYLTWKQLRKLAGESEDIKFALPNSWDAIVSESDYRGNITEAFFYKLFTFLDVRDVKLAPSRSKLDSYLKVDIVIRLDNDMAIALQVKSSAYRNECHGEKFSQEQVFLYTADNKKVSYPAPASLWADVATVKPIELLLFVSNKLGIPVSSKTRTLVERYKMLKQLAKGNKLSLSSSLIKTLKVTNDEIYNLSFLKLLRIEGGTIYFQ